MNIEYFKKKIKVKSISKVPGNETRNQTKKILIYQHGDFHTEISGFLMYNYANCDIDIHHPHTNSTNNCFKYYESILKKKINYVDKVDEKIYAYIFILTSREIKLFNNIVDKKKYILFKHVNEDITDNFINISLTPLVKANINIMPIYNNINEKKRENNICIIGNMSCGKIRDLDGIANLIKNFKKYEILIFTRKIDEKYKQIYTKYQNVKIYMNLGTTEMIERIQKSKYILTADTEYYNENGNKSGVLTGMIPLALNNDIPLIMTSKLNKIYGLDGVIEYSNMTDVANKLNLMSDVKYNSLTQIFIENKNKIINSNKKKLFTFIKL